MSFFRRPALEDPDRLAARGVLLLALLVYGLTFVGPPDVVDGEVEYQTTSALARTGGFALQGTPEAERIAAEARAATARLATDPDHSPLDVDTLPVRVTAAGVYSWRGIGQSIVALPLYAVGRTWALLAPALEAEGARQAYDGGASSEALAHLVVGLRNPLLGAATAWLLVLAAMRLGVARPRAVLAGLSYAFTTYAWPQARAGLSDVQATFFLFLAFHLVLVAREHLDRLQRPPGRVALGIGAALGMAFLTRIAVAPACLVIAASAEVVMRVGHERIATSRWSPRGEVGVTPRRALLLAALPAVACFAIFVAANLARFGAPLDSGYGDLVGGDTARAVFGGAPGEGLLGLLFSPGRGLFVMAPLLLLLPFGIARAVADGERLLLVTVGALTVGILGPAAFTSAWHGAWTYGPRYLLPALPFLWLLVALGLEYLQRRVSVGGIRLDSAWLNRGALLLAGAGAVVAIGGVVVDPNAHHDLAVQAAARVWSDPADLGLPPETTEHALDEARFVRTIWDPRFAAPFAHWRIFRHRVAGLGEEFPLSETFYVDSPAVVLTRHYRLAGFRHLGWIEFARRFNGPALLPLGVGFVLLVLAVISLVRGLDRTA